MYFVLILAGFYINIVSGDIHPSGATVWTQFCTEGSRVLNDCNWCRCNKKRKFTCESRECGDPFQHFNDAIKELHIGMEGHGAWRTTPGFCEPGVHYHRGDLLCVCTGEGKWPNPVCRDTFRTLHPVEIFADDKAAYQDCLPSKLYLVKCNVCLCPSLGKLDPEYCTKQECAANDPVLKEPETSKDVAEVYAQCDINKTYTLGCKFCICLRNNRLLCDNCTEASICNGKRPGEAFDVDCNTCYCEENGILYCTTKNCAQDNKIEYNIVEKPLGACPSGTLYREDCNLCHCYSSKGVNKIACSTNPCTELDKECIVGTKYKKGCQTCKCVSAKGYNIEVCSNTECTENKGFYALRSNCKAHHVYKKGCNTCVCLSDGKTVKCSEDSCEESAISIDIVPIVQDIVHCPKGRSYKIDCNYCFCIDNGNALCTTMKCD